MASWENVLRTRTDLDEVAFEDLRAFTREWSLLADLGFSDLVMFVRTWDAAGWIAVAHVRPSTAQTLLIDDPVGGFLPRSRATLLERALVSGERVYEATRAERRRQPPPILQTPLEVIPVRRDGAVIAGICRYSSIDQRRTGELEQQYLAACDELLGMVARDDFPLRSATELGAATPRVGDGMLRLDAAGTIVFASPNARTCLRTMGVPEPVVGGNLAEELAGAGRLHAPVDQSAMRVARGDVPGEAEFVGTHATITLRAIPIRDPQPAGGVVLLRDVTEARRQELALLSKDATIREIHHRVKNNLQTVGALLRLQARRMPIGVPRAALLDAVARVDTIALVHDSLSASPGESLDFDEIAMRILAIARDAAAAQEAETQTVVELGGRFGVLGSAQATPLAMCLSEILLNAMEHSHAARAWVHGRRDDGLTMIVADNGWGFDPATAEGLGLQIVATLVADQLHGHLEIVTTGTPTRAPGAVAALDEELDQAGIGPATTVVVIRCAVEESGVGT